MPLCPQITNTPITVVLNADFTVTDVVPVLPANTEQLAEVEILIDGKAEIYYQTTAPVGAGINENDLWFDTDDGNKPYVFRSGVWVSVRDGSIATAQSAANTALDNAAAANAVGVAAQGDATEALADAATAFTKAQNSLQPSAFAIQDVTTKQLTSIDATGLTVYSGSSPTSGARVVLNSVGLAGFNSVGVATFSVSATTGAAVFAGDVTGATITGSSLNIAGKFIVNGSTGIMQTTDAVLQGTLTSSNVTITGGTLTIGTKFSVNNIGVLTASDGIFTGKITSTDATITGGSLTVGATFSVTSAGVLSASSGTIGGTTLGVSSLTGGTIQTSSGSSAVILNGASNAIQFKVASAISGNIVPLGTAGVLMHYGTTPDPTGVSYPKVEMSFASALLQGSASFYIQSTNSGNNALGSFRMFNTLQVDGNTNLKSQTFIEDSSTSANAANARIDASDGRLRRSTASSARFKEEIVNLSTVADLDPSKLLNIPIRAFKFRSDYLDTTDNRSGVLVPGLIAEEVASHYPIAADYGADGSVENWNERFVLPGMLALIQDLYKEIDTLKGA